MTLASAPPPPPPPPATLDDELLPPPEPADVAAAPPAPGWRRLARWWPELLVLAGALVLFAWGLDQNGLGNSYYAAAARSMTASWKNFLYASFDPGGWVTVDKPPLALWLQAASAKVFGLSSWSLLLPSVLSAVGAVALLMAAVRRAWGRTAGMVAGLALALTPVVLAVGRSNNPDMVLVLCLVAAAYATQRAISDHRPRWLYLAGALVGLAFLAKLLAAVVVVPGLWVAYLVAGPGRWMRRLAHVAIASLVFVGVAGVWVAAVDLVPLGQRPFVGGSTDGTARDLVFGYNGFGRIADADAGPGGGGRPGGFGGSGGIDQFGGEPGLTRLFNAGMGDQVMWLAPVAALALAGGLVALARRRLRRAEAGALVLWGGWALGTYVVFASAEGIFHNYYVAELAPALAALVGIGVALARRYRRAGLVAVGMAALLTAALQRQLLDRVDAYEWLQVLVPAGLVVVAVAALAAAPAPTVARRALPWLAGAGLGLALLPAAIWTWSGTQSAQNGTFPDARPVAAAGPGAGLPGQGGGPGGGAFGGPGGVPGGGLSAQALDWLRAEQAGERWLVAVGSSQAASGAIIDGDSVMAIGGFSGSDPTMTPERLAQLVEAGDLRFVQAGDGFGARGGSGSISTVVQQACAEVDATAWGGTGASGIFDCQGRAGEIRAAGTSAGTGTLGGQPGGGPPGAGPPGQPPGRDSGALDDLRACLAEQGVDVAAGPPAFDDPAVRAALAACGRLGPPGG